MHHLPVRHPLPAGTLPLFALSARCRFRHARRNAGLGPDRDVGFHAALPQRVLPLLVGSVGCPSHAVFVVAHVAVCHRHRIDIRMDEPGIPSHRVGDAVDVIPAARVEADEAKPQGCANLHQLKRSFNLLDQDVGLDGAVLQSQAGFDAGQDVVPQRRFLSGLDLRQVEDQAGTLIRKGLVVARDVERGVNDRGGKTATVGVTDVAVIQVQPARPEDLRCEVELLPPSRNSLPSKEALGPCVHLCRDALGRLQEDWVLRKRQPKISLIVQRHRLDLAEGVLAVEHPSVRPGQESVGYVADAAL